MRQRISIPTIAALFCGLLLGSVPHTRAFAQTPEATPQNRPIDPSLDAADADATDHEGRWKRTIEAALLSEQFDDLDRMADQYRRNKTLLPGGDWRLRVFYEALDAPQATDKDYADHLEHLRKWMQLRPESITARVALAISLTRWAWVGRTNATADKVTPEGWQLFNQRATEAQSVLQGAAEMHTMCPQWFSEAMIVGLALDWDSHRMEDIFDRAVQFEPDYPYFYRERANYLLPKWDGQPNDATNFAQRQADKLGGDLGDRMYFEIATAILRRGNGNLTAFVQQMDWARIQRGYAILTTQAGTSLRVQNQLAFMAYKFKDANVAKQQFALIGDQWSRGVWKQRLFFERARDWSTGHNSWP